MSRFIHWAGVVALVLPGAGLWGCRSPLDADPSLGWSTLDDTFQPAAASAASAGSPPISSRGGSRPAEPLPDDVEELVALALERNAALRAAAYRVERLRQRRPQETALDDPMLSVMPWGQMPEASVSQRLPWPGKRDARGQMADAQAAAAERQLAAQRLEVAAAVRRAYWSHRYAARAQAVVQRDRDLLDQLRRVAQARLRAGSVEQQDVLVAEVELAQVDARLLTFAQQEASASAALNHLLDRPSDAPVPQPPAGNASTDPVAATLELDAQTLLASAAQHPRLAALRQEVERYRQQRRLARLERWPDLTLSLMHEADGGNDLGEGDGHWSLGLGVNLPLWQGKRDAARREALAGAWESAAMLAEEQNLLAFRVQDALGRVRADVETLALFRDRLLPQARQAVESAQHSYRAGRGDFLPLIDNWRRLTELGLMHERAATQLQQDLADLASAASLPLSAPPQPAETPAIEEAQP